MSMVTLEKPRPYVTVVRLNRPERLNAMSFELVEPLYEVLKGVAAEARREGRKPRFVD